MHIPASPFPRRARGGWCKGTPESGAEDGNRTRGLDHGVVALCPLSYIRLCCEARFRPVPVLPRGILLMNVAAECSCAARWPQSRRTGKQKGPDPSGIRASRVRSEEDALTRPAVPDVCGDRDNRASTASTRSPEARVRTRSCWRPPWRPRRQTYFGPLRGSNSSLAVLRLSRCVLKEFLCVATNRRKYDGADCKDS